MKTRNPLKALMHRHSPAASGPRRTNSPTGAWLGKGSSGKEMEGGVKEGKDEQKEDGRRMEGPTNPMPEPGFAKDKATI